MTSKLFELIFQSIIITLSLFEEMIKPNITISKYMVNTQQIIKTPTMFFSIRFSANQTFLVFLILRVFKWKANEHSNIGLCNTHTTNSLCQ